MSFVHGSTMFTRGGGGVDGVSSCWSAAYERVMLVHMVVCDSGLEKQVEREMGKSMVGSGGSLRSPAAALCESSAGSLECGLSYTW